MTGIGLPKAGQLHSLTNKYKVILNGRAKSSTKLSVWDLEGHRKRLVLHNHYVFEHFGHCYIHRAKSWFQVFTPLSVLLNTRKRYRSLRRLKGSWSIRTFKYSSSFFDWNCQIVTCLCRQRSWTLDEVKKPLHVETGYVRVPSPKKVEMVISQPTGMNSSHISCC